MSPDLPIPLFDEQDLVPPAGHLERFGTRWRLVSAGLSNVWRYGDLVLDAASGRLLLRGPNGTGKTTALEALWPYLLDLNAHRLVAGKARTTSLSSLMREGTTGKRRYGYVWMTLAGPGSEGTHSFGVRLQFSAGASPAVKVIPFAVPGAPIIDFPLYEAGRAPLMLERFAEIVTAAGGQIFEDEDAYVMHLAARVWRTTAPQLRDLAERIRAVRNPSLLGEVSPRAAADALREALPGVAEDIVIATAEALAESDATRDAFNRDSEAADVLEEFAATWAGHVASVISDAHAVASEAADAVVHAEGKSRRLESSLATAQENESEARLTEANLKERLRDVNARIEALEANEHYKAGERIGDLDTLLVSQRKHAEAAIARLKTAGMTVRDQTISLTARLDELTTDLDEHVSTVSSVDTTANLDKPISTWSSTPQSVVTIAGTTVDPGPKLVVDADPRQLDATAERWTKLAHTHSARAGDAQLALSDFERTVQPVLSTARRAKDVAHNAELSADAGTQKESQATAAAHQAAHALLDELAEWPTTQSDLYPELAEGDIGITLWTIGDLDDLRAAEPGQILDEARSWRLLAADRGARARATLLERRRGLLSDAERLITNATACRKEAIKLRSGQLLPLPRPSWLTASDDSRAFAAALEWVPGFSDSRARALIETALAASGLLSATLTNEGTVTSAWQVRPGGPPVPHNLSAVLAVDGKHPLADVATAVLNRIALHPTVFGGWGDGAALTIGRDGTFRTGQLFGRAPGADDPGLLPLAQHVGGVQRRAAALARAGELDGEAAALDEAAAGIRAAADRLSQRVTEIDDHVVSFPRLDRLEEHEAKRVSEAKEAARLRTEAAEAEAKSIRASEHATARRREWADRTSARSLPIDLDTLARLHADSMTAAKTLNTAAAAVKGRLRPRLERLLAEIERLDETVVALPRLRSDAQGAYDAAKSTAEKLRVLRETIGQAARKAHDDRAAACAERDQLQAQVDPARELVEEASKDVARLGEKLKAARGVEQAARPAAKARHDELQALLAAPGVAEVLFRQPHVDMSAEENILDMVTAALTGRRTYSRKTLRERYDSARAALAGIWTLDPADSYGQLDTFVLTHDDMSFTPVSASRRAQELKAKAQAALDAAEESALRDFVVGRLPSAIGTAWTRMHDWADDVNRKMRSAAASSGVAVQVRVRLSDDLSPAVRTVYELACKVADADRTPEQKTLVGQALQQLIGAADGESMADRLSSAVDVRGWVDVHYEVTRPGGSAQRWSSRTGLSGGERRLVVLAPMIAAVAAAYDRLVQHGLRLIALDEVPAEVDERGREGLARYLAELDLDLICTSYLWDGAPGAWDGIDAHDLEAGSDGTVVSFPMLIRGMHGLASDLTPEADHE
ncbi:SbcC/MukB-like Walker B domain-containing protein [Sphaerisporangium sp. B11E5]|uniref:SbcC/MukB-like Walker B domain-containing protein n=1 Tax=Sphaerisporangium sp. B11E5 TaxID=3153563 RepID=UPI00325D7CE4